MGNKKRKNSLPHTRRIGCSSQWTTVPGRSPWPLPSDLEHPDHAGLAQASGHRVQGTRGGGKRRLPLQAPLHHHPRQPRLRSPRGSPSNRQAAPRARRVTTPASKATPGGRTSRKPPRHPIQDLHHVITSLSGAHEVVIQVEDRAVDEEVGDRIQGAKRRPSVQRTAPCLRR